MLTDVLGIAPANVGLLMSAVFLGDLVFDLAAGFIAGWCQTAGIGYSRIIAIGALPCAIAFALIYSLPALGLRHLAVVAAAVLAFRGAYAIIDVPHNSLLARVASDSRARGRAAGYRYVFSSLASMAIATVVVPIVKASRHGRPDDLAVMGGVAGLLFSVAMIFAAWSSRPEHRQEKSGVRARSIRLLPKFDALFGAFAVIALATGFATPVFNKMVLYIATYVLREPELAGRILLAITAGQLPGAVLWILLVRRHEKTTLLIASHVVASLGIVLFALAGANAWVLTGLAVVIGVGFAGVYMLPWAILADIVDFSQYRHRERRETAAFASTLVILKAGSTASGALIGWTLGKIGYAPGGLQSPTTLTGMKVLAFGIPVLGAIVAVATLSRLRVSHRAHARVVRIISTRAQASAGRQT
jgi:GPH family glycoside/pentoside/hexuronide:cation symporter